MLQHIHSGWYFKTHMLMQRIHFRWCCQRVHPWHPGRRPCIFAVWQFLLALNQITFVWFFSAVYFQMSLQRTWVRASKVSLVTFARLSLRCIFKRFLKLPAWKQVISHWLHLFGCLHCVFSNVPSKHLDQRKQSRIDYMCFIFPHCAFLHVSSNRLPERMHSHIGCIY